MTQEINKNRIFAKPNHVIMLWQYYGKKDNENFLENFKNSDLQWGIRGSELSSFGVIEGKETDLFIKMARRAGSIFSENEADSIKDKILEEIRNKNKARNPESIGVTNNNKISVWLNYLLYYLSIVASENKKSTLIQVNPFTLSLFALEQLLKEHKINKVDKSVAKLENIKFDVAFSFPGEKRKFVSNIADIIRDKLNQDKLFYDYDYQSQLTQPNIDILLQKIYHDNSKLIVIFLSSEYMEKEWCGLEWRAIRDIIKSKKDNKIMFIKFDDKKIDGLFGIDGYIDANFHSKKNIVKFILERIKLINNT